MKNKLSPGVLNTWGIEEVGSHVKTKSKLSFHFRYSIFIYSQVVQTRISVKSMPLLRKLVTTNNLMNQKYFSWYVN